MMAEFHVEIRYYDLLWAHLIVKSRSFAYKSEMPYGIGTYNTLGDGINLTFAAILMRLHDLITSSPVHELTG